MTERREHRPDGGDDGLIRALAATRRLEPPGALDRRVRALIARPAVAPVRSARPLPLLLAAVTALLLLGTALGVSLSQTSVGGDAPLVAAILVTAYLGLSATATLPLLVRKDLFRALKALRVNP